MSPFIRELVIFTLWDCV